MLSTAVFLVAGCRWTMLASKPNSSGVSAALETTLDGEEADPVLCAQTWCLKLQSQEQKGAAKWLTKQQGNRKLDARQCGKWGNSSSKRQREDGSVDNDL